MYVSLFQREGEREIDRKNLQQQSRQYCNNQEEINESYYINCMQVLHRVPQNWITNLLRQILTDLKKFTSGKSILDFR